MLSLLHDDDNDKKLILTREFSDRVELVDYETGELIELSPDDWQASKSKYTIEEICPDVDPLAVPLPDRDKGWLEALREKRAQHLVDHRRKSAKARAKGPAKPRAPRQLAKAPKDIQAKLALLPKEMREQMAQSMGFKL